MWRRFLLSLVVVYSVMQVASLPHATAQEALLTSSTTTLTTIVDPTDPSVVFIQAYITGDIPKEPAGTVSFLLNNEPVEGCSDVATSYILTRLQANCTVAAAEAAAGPITASFHGTDTIGASSATFVQ